MISVEEWMDDEVEKAKRNRQAVEALKALKALERIARDGHGPVFTQSSVATSKTHIGLGKTTDDFCAAIVALGRMSE